MSTGTGLIITLDCRLPVIWELLFIFGSSLALQTINFDVFTTYGNLLAEFSTLSLSLKSKLLIPLSFIIFPISSSCFCFLFI